MTVAESAALKLVIVVLAEQRYAFHVTAVERVLPMVAVSLLPKAPAIVLGVIDLHGIVVPVVDLRRRLGFPPDGLVEWLDQGTRLRVKLAESGEIAQPGTVYLSREGFQMGITKDGRLRLTKEPAEDGFSPSASFARRSRGASNGSARPAG